MNDGRFEMTLACSVARVLVVVASVSASFAIAGAPDQGRRETLIHMVRQDCGSCHGLTLAGGLGPALLPESLRDKPAESLVATILGGRPGTAMPPWRGFITDDEARWIVDRLRDGFPSIAERN